MQSDYPRQYDQKGNTMEAVNKTNGAVYTIRKDNSGRWYGYCPQTKEYTPAFLKLKGYKICEE